MITDDDDELARREAKRAAEEAGAIGAIGGRAGDDDRREADSRSEAQRPLDEAAKGRARASSWPSRS